MSETSKTIPPTSPLLAPLKPLVGRWTMEVRWFENPER